MSYFIHPRVVPLQYPGRKVLVQQGATGSCNIVIVCLTPAMPKKMPRLMNSEWDSNFSSLLCIIAPMPFPIARLPVRLNWKRIQLCIYYHMLYKLFYPSGHVRTHCTHVCLETHAFITRSHVNLLICTFECCRMSRRKNPCNHSFIHLFIHLIKIMILKMKFISSNFLSLNLYFEWFFENVVFNFDSTINFSW